MPPDLTRRAALAAAPGLAFAGPALAKVPAPLAAMRALLDIERRSRGRLGVCAEGEGLALHHRADERFPMCSTFKMVLAACVLARADAGEERLDALVPVPASALIDYAPVTEPASKAGRPLTVEQLCEAAVKLSDNTAANLLLARVGGPAGLTAWAHGHDPVFRLDRTEPTLNESLAGDPRDTTTPAAMVGELKALLFGEVLKPVSRARLFAWMTACTTGLHKLRAGLPEGWGAADKTGNNGVHTSGDNAVLTPPGGGRIFVSCYVAQSKLRGPAQEALFADVARVIVEAHRG